jgi:phosphonate transport system substrate-binding protein
MTNSRPAVPALVAALVLVSTSCDARPGGEYVPVVSALPARADLEPEYSFGVFPLHNPIRLFEVYQPMLEAVERAVPGARFRLEAGRDYPTYEARLNRGSLHFALLNPYQALRAQERGYRIFAKMGDDDRMRGIIVTRRNAGLRDVKDLAGSTISFPAPTALAASMMTKVFMKRHGLDVEREATIRYVGSQDSAVLNVHLGLSKAGCTWPPTWDALQREHPEVVEQLEIRWQTESLPSLAVVVRADVPDDCIRRVADVLTGLHASIEGRAILAGMQIPRYEAATSTTYEPVRRFIDDYERLFGALPSLEGQR